MAPPTKARPARLRAVRTAEAKNRLSELLAGVRRGMRYRIFDRDTPVADLVPVDDWRTDESHGDDVAQRRRLVEQGVIRAGEPGGAPREILRAGPRLVHGSAVAVLIEERRTGR
jgi:prevent-host-death family protein